MKKIIFVALFFSFSVHANNDNCPRNGEYQAVDMSAPTLNEDGTANERFFETMRWMQVHTIIRYYDYKNETIPGKTLTRSERRAIAEHAFYLMVVFQHHNNRISSFTEDRGRADANRSLDLATENEQPRSSAIYFGVDGDWSSADHLMAIKTYFRTAGPIIRSAGYKIGGYGSGLVCTQLLNEGLVDYCWLANATGWTGYTEFSQSQRWSMKQSYPRICGGLEVDFNKTNPRIRNFGQFR